MSKCACSAKVIFSDNGKIEHGIVYCPLHQEAEAMLEALQTVKTWFERMRTDQYEKLVHNQTLESASENWDNLLQEPLEMTPILEIITRATQGQGEEKNNAK